MKDKTVTDKHVLFWGSIFSNFAPAPFTVDGIQFYNSEQYFMYQKAKVFNDDETAKLIVKVGKNPKEAKRLGRMVKNYDDNVWNDIRFDAMYNAIKLKFDNNEPLKKELMSYNDKTFVEASPIDRIWGIGMSEDNPDADDESKWKGQNLLGKALTKLRDEYLMSM